MRKSVLTAGVVAVTAAAGVAASAISIVQRLERRSSLNQRAIAPQGEVGVDAPVRSAERAAAAVYPLEFRTIDGVGNNPSNPSWGAAHTPFRRMAPVAYADGVGAPARASGPNVRTVSNALGAQSLQSPNGAGATDYLWQWGQFLDHDLDETPVAAPTETLDVPVPVGDAHFDPMATGSVTIPLDRSAHVLVGGVREQVNLITSYIDASNVYGSDDTRALELRTNDGTGRLKTSAGDLLPFNTAGLPNAPTGADPTLFLAGDVRVNEQAALTAMHTLWVREHNHWADTIRAAEPSLTGDEVYERARAIVAAEMQAITYNEFLPLLLGPGAIAPYAGYDDGVDASIANEFATAAYRVGHTMLSETIRRVDATGATIAAGDLPLRDAFFAPHEVIDHGVDPIFRGLASQPAQEIDCLVIDDVRNFLFGPPGAGGFDLASLNLQRGRDHGIASYNDLRIAVGRAPAATFFDICADPSVAFAFANTYNTPDDVDPWIGLLAEPHAPGAMVGETLRRILADQFTRLRDGDRFWYEAYMPQDMIDLVNQQTLATVIRRNTGIGAELQDDVFRVAPPCAADLNGDGAVDGADLGLLIGAWGASGPTDLNADGVTDGADLGVLLGTWGDC
jgi:hypothetical protein